MNIREWVPGTNGKSYASSPTLEVLKDHRSDFTVLSGLSHPHCEGGHTGADTWLTAANLKAKPGSDYTNTLSVDQVLAEIHGKHTRFPSLQLSDYPGTGNAGHSNTLSFDRKGTPLPGENSPQHLFERLFVPEAARDRSATLRQYAEQRSILDDIGADAKASIASSAWPTERNSTNTFQAYGRPKPRFKGWRAGSMCPSGESKRRVCSSTACR